jgi:uncharacterized protein (DUF58 family)
MLYKQTVLLTGITFLGLTGYVLRLEQLYFMAALFAFVGIGSYILCALSVRGLEVERGPTRKIYEGERCDIKLTLINTSRLPKVFLGVAESLPQWLEPLEEARFIVPLLLPKRSIELTYRVRGTKRGAYLLEAVAVSSTDLLGAFRVERRAPAAQEIVVYPSPTRVSPEPLAGVRAFGGAETEQLAASQAGLEFYGIRDYRPGDALRRIHWPSTARLGDFAVVEFEESFGADLVIAIDLRRGTEFGSGRDTSLEMAIKAAASLAAFAVESGANVVIAGQDARRRYLTSARRYEELPAVFEALARMEADGDTPLPEVMAGLDEAAAGAWAVVLTAAPDESLAAATEVWLRRQAQVVAVLFDGTSWGAERPPDVYSMSRRIEAAGVRVEIFRRGDELRHLTARAVSDAG